MTTWDNEVISSRIENGHKLEEDSGINMSDMREDSIVKTSKNIIPKGYIQEDL